jgi:type IV pilus assembly protein PilC
MILDRWILKLPVIGEVIHQTVVLRFTRSLATLVGSGISILNALDTACEMADNQVIESEIKRVRAAVERGEKMSAAMAAGKRFHPDVVQMVKAGEESGRLDSMLDKVADFYEMRVNFSLKQMTVYLEPLLLVGMAGIVVLIMASLILPMFDMVKVLQKGGLR